jgi:hypothetical protein
MKTEKPRPFSADGNTGAVMSVVQKTVTANPFKDEYTGPDIRPARTILATDATYRHTAVARHGIRRNVDRKRPTTMTMKTASAALRYMISLKACFFRATC